MENWRKFLNEEETTLQSLNDLLFGDDKHPGGRPYNRAAEAMSDDSEPLEEQEGVSQQYEKIIQDFIAINANISDMINKGSLELEIAEKTQSSTRSAQESINNFEKVRVSASLTQAAKPLIEAANIFLTELKEIEQIMQKSFNEYKSFFNDEKFENYIKVRNAISLFTGESVKTVRDPSKFDPAKSGGGESRRIKLFQSFEKQMQSPERINDTIENMLNKLSLIERDMDNEEQEEQAENLFSELDRQKNRFKNIERQFTTFRNENLRTKTTKESYEFANGFLKYVAQRRPPLFIPEGKEIYRGISLTLDAFNALEGALNTMSNVEFAGRDIASWTADEDVAYNFSLSGSGDADMSVVLIAKAVKGMYVEDFTRFPEEYEVICGGSVKVLRHEIEDTGTLALEVEFI